MLERHFTRLLALLTGVFAAVRLLAYQQMSGSIVTKIPVLDSDTYFKWGYQLSQGGGHPPGPFWLGPGYAQFISWVFRATGDISPQIVLLAQMFLSVVTFVLIVLLARRCFGRAAAVATGVLAIFYAPWLYYDGILLSASWILFLNSAMLYLLVEHGGVMDDAPRSIWAWAVAGALCALSAIARPSVLPFAALLLLFVCWRVWKQNWKVVFPLVFTLALVLVHLPISVRNSSAGGSSVFVTASGGVNFFIGNRSGATGVYDELDFVQSFDAQREAEGYRAEASRRSGKQLTLPQSAAFWRDQALRDVFQKPLLWVGVQLKKFWWLIRNEEVANNFSFRAMEMSNSVVNLLPLRWGLLLPLALAGLFLLWQTRRRLVVFGLYAASYVVTVMLFFVSSEYRFPLIVLLLPLGGAAIAQLLDSVRSKRTTAAAIGLGIYVVLVLVANAPSREAAHTVEPRVDYANLGSIALSYQMYPEALAMFARSLSVDPDFQIARLGLAEALWATRNYDQAREEYARAGVAPPDSLSGAPLDALRAMLDSVSTSQGDSAALAMLDREIPHPGSLAIRDLWVERARLQAASNNYGGAYLSILEAHKLDPDDPEWLFWAAQYILELDFPQQADSLYQEAINRYPAYAPARVEKGFLALEQGDIDEAVRQSRELDKIQIGNDTIQAAADTLDAALRRLNW
ncbi:MAG: tetratricopeptide repeat protein [bacterium]|nr:tetratricopeptide repeat protein [bacterium]